MWKCHEMSMSAFCPRCCSRLVLTDARMYCKGDLGGFFSSCCLGKKETQLSTNGCPTKRAKKQKLNSRSWALRMKQEEGLRYSAFECLLQWRSSAQHLVLIANETLPSKPNLFQLQTKHLLRFPGVLRNLLSILLRQQLRCARWRYRHQGRNVCCKTYFTSCTALLAVSFFLVAFLESCLCSILYTMKSDPTSNIEIETIDASDNALGPWLV